MGVGVHVTFWGTRGSIAKAGPTTVRYGGNTACVSVRTDACTLCIMDHRPRVLDDQQVERSRELGRMVEAELQSRTHEPKEL